MTPMGHSGLGRPIERITYHEDRAGFQQCRVYFVGDSGEAGIDHTAKSINGLAHELALQYGINPQDVLNKRLA